MRTFIYIGAAALVGFAGGWLLSPRTGGQAEDQRIGKTEQRERSTSLTAPSATAPKLAAGTIEERLETAFASGVVAFAEMRALMDALASLSAGNASDFARFFQQQPFDVRQITLWQMYFSAWGEIDPQGAIAFIDQRFPEAATRKRFYASVVDTWRHGSFDAAFAFSVDQFLSTDESIDSTLAIEYLESLAGEDPDQALALAMKLGDGEFVLEMTARRISQLAKTDRNQALDAIDALSGDTHLHAASQFVIDWANQEPAAAAVWLSDNFDERYGPHVLGQIASAYIRTDPQAALRWIEDLPGSGSRAKILAEAVRSWAQADPDAVARWLESEETRPENDPAVVALGQQLADQRPQEVIEEWVPRIADAHAGNRLLAEVSSDWERSNPTEYREWLGQTEALPSEVKQRLLARESPTDAGDPESGRTSPRGETSTGIDQGRDR